MTRLAKVLVTILCLVVVVAGFVFFWFGNDSQIGVEPVDPAPPVGVPATPATGAVGYGIIDTTTKDEVGSDTNQIYLPPSEDDISDEDTRIAEGELPISGDDGDESATAPMVNDDGIPTSEAILTAQESDKNLYGRLVIPVAGINVRLYQTTDSRVIQAEDSAVLFNLKGAAVIADMWKQGFNNLQKVTRGSEMYIVTAADTNTYLCSRSEYGVISDGDIKYSDDVLVSEAPLGAITCYGQVDSSGRVWICEFTDDGKTGTPGVQTDEQESLAVGEGNSSTDAGNQLTGDDVQVDSGNNSGDSGDWTGSAGYVFP